MTNVFVGMYMVVLEEYMKEECTQNKELFLINGKEEILNKPNTEINLSLLEIINDSKWNLCENEKKEEIKIYKKENWFIGLKEDWTKKEYEYLNSITDESIDKNESLLITNKSLSDIHRYISKKHWNDMQMKWIDEDNEMDWIKVAQTQIVNNKKESYKKPKDKKKNIEFNNVQDENVQDKNIQNKIIKINNIENNNIPNKNIKYNNIQNNIIPNKKNVHYLNKIEDNVHNIQNVSNINICKLKNIIEIHMVLLEDSKNEEWTSNKGDFLEICINQYMKEEEEKNKSTIAQLNELINQNNKQMIIQNILHENNKLCFKWIERNKYIQQKWKSQEWFHTLKNNWKIQENYYKEIDKEKKKILEQSKKRGTNIMLERQKLIWKKWLAKHVTHTEIEEHEDTLNKLFTEEEKNKFVSEIENLNISHLGNKHSIDVLKNYSKKKLLTMLWIEIHMKVLEEHKRDEIFEIKAILLDKCINHMKKHQNSEINQRIIEMIVSVKNNTLYQNKYSHVTNDIQNDQGSKQTKFQWINEEYTLSHNSHKDNIAHESKYMIDNNIINIHQGILIKHLDDFQFKWIDDNNEYDWLKISSDENINDKKFNGIQLYKIPTETNKKNDKDHQKKKFYETNIYNESHSEKDSKTIQLNNKTNSENSQLLSKTLSTFNNATNIKDTNNHLNNIIHDTENNKYIPNCEQIDSLNKYKIINYKKVIEIHLTVLEECKNEEWRNIRQLFFETCINEIKNEPWFYQDFFNKENIKEQNYDNIYSQNFIYNEWINENKNLLEIYKKKEWFNSFMHEWKTELNSYNVEQTQKEENKNTKEIYYKEIMDNMFERIQNGLYMLEPPEYNDTEVNFLNINEFQKENIFETQNMNNEKIVNNSNTESKNPMIDYQNMVWRSWIQKHIKNIREEKKEERFNKLIEEHTQGRNIKELQTYTMNKMLITKMFVQIHMMILEEYKKEEYSIMKDIFLDRCMNQIDNLEYSINEKKYMLEIIIEMKKNKSTNKNHKHISDEYKNNILFEELKKEWKYRENEYKNILSNQNMINYYNTKSSINKLFEMQKNIITKHLEDIHLKWIQNEKNRNILIQTFHNPYIHNIKNIK
ncbi:surface-associated interspersed protein 13.1, putative [Plasmodium sp.]|nr:surface-associated interspersed protein 13.1, putative [Plasmodium sp.]